MSRQDQYDVTVSVAYNKETKDFGTFDKMTGGGIDSSESKFRPGAMGEEKALGGYKTVENLVVSRLFDHARDQPDVSWIIGAVGKGEVTITKQPLDVDGNPTGKAMVYKGKLKRFTPPEHDSESTAAALFELEISAGSSVTVAT